VRDTIVSRFRIAVVVGGIAVAAFLAVGCGLSGDDEFASQAKSICTDFRKQILALEPPANPQSASELVPWLTQVVAIGRDFDTKLHEIPPPEDLQSERDKLVANTDKQLAVTEKMLAAAKANDTVRAQALSLQLDYLDKRNKAIGRSMGLECPLEPQGG
jgi:hypothetical protein